MKIYIAGKITGELNYKDKFKNKESELKSQGHEIMNPATLPDGFEWHEYMHICFAMIDVCESVYLMNCWENSLGARKERDYAISSGKGLIYEC